MEKPKVLIIVRGGIADPVIVTGEVELHIVDRDNLEGSSPEDAHYAHGVYDNMDVHNDDDFERELKAALE
jgi:hypothetical protein